MAKRSKRGAYGDKWVYGKADPEPSLGILDGYIRLAAAVLARAADEARNGDVGACNWLLSSPDAEQYALFSGVDTEQVRKMAANWMRDPAGAIVVRLVGEGPDDTGGTNGSKRKRNRSRTAPGVAVGAG